MTSIHASPPRHMALRCVKHHHLFTLTSETPFDLFISYRREGGSAEARVIQSALISRGLRVFLDVEDLHKGYFDEQLLQRISDPPNFSKIQSHRGTVDAQHSAI